MPAAKTGVVQEVPWSNLTSWDDGLDASQKAVVAECVESIATITSKTYKEMAAAFAKVKAALPDRNWVKWTNNAELNVGARTIQDLAGANAWLESTAVDDAVLGRISARALCMIANCNEKKQKQLEARLVAGEILTFKQVKDHVEGTAAKDEAAPAISASKRIALLEQQLEASRSFTAAQVAAADAAIEERDALAAQVAQLSSLLQQAMESADVAPWLKETIQSTLSPRLLDGVGRVVMRKTSDKAISLMREPAAKS